MLTDIYFTDTEIRFRGKCEVVLVVANGITKALLKIRRQLENEDEATASRPVIGEPGLAVWRAGVGDEHGPEDGQYQRKGGHVMTWTLAFVGESMAQEPCLESRVSAAPKAFTVAANKGTVTLTMSIALQFGIRGDAENLDAMNGKEVLIVGKDIGQLKLPGVET